MTVLLRCALPPRGARFPRAGRLSAFPWLDDRYRALAVTASGRQAVASLGCSRSPKCLLTGIVIGRSRPSTVGRSVQKNFRKADTESR